MLPFLFAIMATDTAKATMSRWVKLEGRLLLAAGWKTLPIVPDMQLPHASARVCSPSSQFR
jgi:hypothetical protein